MSKLRYGYVIILWAVVFFVSLCIMISSISHTYASNIDPDPICQLRPMHIHMRNAPWILSPSPDILRSLKLANSQFQSMILNHFNVIKYDEYTVTVNRMPNGLTPEQFLTNLAQNALNGAIKNTPGGKTFSDINEFHRRISSSQPVNFLTGSGATSTLQNPPLPRLGDIYDIDIKGPDDGSVILVEQDSSHFSFQTITTPITSTGSHPENGVREFGFERNSDGSVTFFTRGASESAIPLGKIDPGIPLQIKGWTALMEGIGETLYNLDSTTTYKIDKWTTALPANIDPALEDCQYKKPIADAQVHPDQTVYPYTIVELDGSGSKDPNPADLQKLVGAKPLTYSWKQISPFTGGELLSRDTENIAKPHFVAPVVSVPTTFTFQLIVDNGIRDSEPKTVSITVNPLESKPGVVVYTVNTNKDDRANLQDSHCTPQHCSIQEAIKDANSHPGIDVIKFTVPSDQTTIRTSTSLPDITDPVIIDGTTQPGYSERPIVQISGDGTAKYGLRIKAGSSVVKGIAINGFAIAQISLEGDFPSDTSAFKPVSSGNYYYSITPKGGNIIQGNYIGINTDGNTTTPSGTSRGWSGINIEESSNNKIGGSTPQERNVISGNLVSGIYLFSGYKRIDISINPDGSTWNKALSSCDLECASSNNIIQGNYLGTDYTGKKPVQNGLVYGIAVVASHDNLIGGNVQSISSSNSGSYDVGNIISGNSNDGIFVTGGATAADNKIQGNLIGLDVDGQNKLPNSRNGINFAKLVRDDGTTFDPPILNTIGGNEPGDANVVSGNGKNGVLFDNSVNGNQIQGNYIGTDITGRKIIGNTLNGIEFTGAFSNTIGGILTSSLAPEQISSSSEGTTRFTSTITPGGTPNTISGNSQNGIKVDTSSHDNYVYGNYIGTDAGSATLDIGNANSGIFISDSKNNIIGSSGVRADSSSASSSITDTHTRSGANVISNNKHDGISITESNSNTGGLLSIGNTIRANDIHANTRLGINLGNDVVTANDIKDPKDNLQNDLDNGPNELMNYPVNGSVYYNPKNDQTIITGVVNTPNPESTIVDVYANSQTHSSGFGEGRIYLGQLTPDSSGHFIAAISDGDFFSSDNANSNSNNIGYLYPVITATTTGQKGSTSEFSAEFTHVNPPKADPGAQQTVKENTTVTLDGSNSTAGVGSSANGNPSTMLSYKWQQVPDANGILSKTVALNNADRPVASFLAPILNASNPAEADYIVLYFKLTVTDSNGQTDNDIVPIVIVKDSSTVNGCIDADNDGICNTVDTAPNSFSNEFSDISSLGGNTVGTIVDRGNQTLLIDRDFSTAAGGGGSVGDARGIRIIDLFDNFMSFHSSTNNNNKIGAPSKFVACDGNTVQFSLTAGEDAVINCNKDGTGKVSFILKNINNNNPVDIAFSSKDNLTHFDAFLNYPGQELIFDPNASEISSPAGDSGMRIPIITDKGNIIGLQPGQTQQISKQIVDTTILSATDFNGQTIQNGSSTNSSNILFNFNGSSSIQGATIAGFICNLDGNASNSIAYLCNTSPFGFSNLQSGSYTFDVMAFDFFGNTGGDAKFTWSINNAINNTNTTRPITPQPISNHRPIVNSQIVKSAANNNPLNIALTATDPDPFTKLLTFSLVTSPSHGTISNFNSSSGQLTYTPTAGFIGIDNFTFRANDGYLDSDNATVSIKVGNHIPVALDQNGIIGHRNTPIVISLNATDSDLPIDSLTYSILSNPSHGTISNFNSSSGKVTYIPSQDYLGTDEFTFKVNDGTVDSDNFGTVSISVTSAAPVVNISISPPSQVVSAGQKVILNGDNSFDSDGYIASYLWEQVSGPQVSLSNNNTSTASFIAPIFDNGVDVDLAFKLTLTDDANITNSSIAHVKVKHINHAPTVQDQNIIIDANTPGKVIALTATDADKDDSIKFIIVSPPVNGSLSQFNQTTGQLIYTPKTEFNGIDDFFYVANDGHVTSTSIGKVSIKVGNRAPIALDKNNVFVKPNQARIISLPGYDPDAAFDNNEITFSILTNPQNGTIDNFDSRTGNVTYIPNNSVTTGTTDKFTYRVNDGIEYSKSAGTVSLIIRDGNIPPEANAGIDKIVKESTRGIILSGESSADPDGSIVSYSWKQISGIPVRLASVTSNNSTTKFDAPSVAKTASLGFNLTVTDNNGTSASDTVSISVTNANDPTSNGIVINPANNGALFERVDHDGTVTQERIGEIVTSSLGFAIDTSNNNSNYIYVSSCGNYNCNDVGLYGGVEEDTSDLVRKFDSRGNLITTWHIGGFADDHNPPVVGGIAVDHSGRYVYTIDRNNNRIQKFLASSGSPVTSWQDVQFGTVAPVLEDIEIDSHNNVYVYDSNNQNLQKFDSNGNLIQVIDRLCIKDLDPNLEILPCSIDLAIDSSDNIYSILPGSAIITKYDNDGNVLRKFDDGSRFLPPIFHSIAIDSSDNIYRVRYIKYNFTDTQPDPSSVCYDPNYSTSCGHNVFGKTYPGSKRINSSVRPILEKLDSNGKLIRSFGLPYSGLCITFSACDSLKNGELLYPQHIALDSYNDIYVVDNNRIQVFDQGDDQPPVATDKIYVTNQSVAKNITLAAADRENEPVIFSLNSYPIHGQIKSFNATKGTLVYEPYDDGFFGMDNFTFHATDTLNQQSNTATASVLVLPNHLDGTLIGPEGGTITVNGTTLTIPPGALSDYKRFDIKTIPFVFRGTSTRNVNDISPSGTQFNTPADYSTDYNPSQVPANPSSSCIGDISNGVGDSGSQCIANHLSIASLNTDSGQWQPYPTEPLGDGSNRLQTQIPHLSIYGIVLAPVAHNQTVTTDQNHQANIKLVGDDLLNQAISYTISTNPSHGTITSFNSTTGDAVYLPAAGFSGNDAFTFKVNNGIANSNKEGIVSIAVRNATQNGLFRPIANAGPDRVISIGNTNNSSSDSTTSTTGIDIGNTNINNRFDNLVILDGSASKDSDGNIIAYSWKQTAGPSVVLNNANTAIPTFTVPSNILQNNNSTSSGNSSNTATNNTLLTFELTVTDNNGLTDTDTANVFVVKSTSSSNNGGNSKPIAVVIPNELTVNENTTNVILNGTGSYDPDSGDSITSYSWTQTAGPIVTLQGASTATPTFTAPSVTADTVLKFDLTVTDNHGDVSTPATVSVLVRNVNIPPIADAGPAQTVNENTTGVVLDGTKSLDKDGNIVSYTWKQLSGTNVTLSGADTSKATFTAPSVTTKDDNLAFKLTVTDNDNASSAAMTNILIKNVNIAPMANAGTNQTVNENTAGVKLDGTGSYDRDGTIASYHWNQTAGPTVTLQGTDTATPTFTAPSVNADTTLTFALSVTDNDGSASNNTNGAATNVLVKNVNVAPMAIITPANQTVNASQVVIMDGSASNDNKDGGNISSYQWQQIAGTPVTLTGATTGKASFTAPSANTDSTLTFKLTVTDNDGGASNSTTTNVVVKRSNQPPIANAGSNQTVNGSSTVTLDGSKSADPDGGTISTYSWTQTAGPPVTLQGTNTATPTFIAPSNLQQDATLTFSLKVTDSDGGAASTNTALVNVIVKKQIVTGNQPPVAKAVVLSSTGNIIGYGSTVTLDGSSSYDPDGGSIVSYLWQQTSGPIVILQGANTAKASFTAPQPNTDTTLTFTLTVKDSDGGAIGTTSVNIVVAAHPGTIGYWSNHQQQTVALLPQLLGKSYKVDSWTKASSVFNSATASNAYEQLAAQLLATKLDIKNGSATCTAITNAVSQADSMLTNAGYKGPSSTKAPTGSTKTTVTNLQTTLDTYNNYGCMGINATTTTTTNTPIISSTSPQTANTTDAPSQSSSSLSSPTSSPTQKAAVSSLSPSTTANTAMPSSSSTPISPIAQDTTSTNATNGTTKSSSLTTTTQKQQQQTRPLQGNPQQQQQPQYSATYPNQVLPPSSPYQLQQQQQQLQKQQPLPFLPPPIAVAGMSQIVDANTNVMLDGRNSYIPLLQQQQQQYQQPNRMITAYQWTQIPVGVPVNITGANTPTPTFTAPILPYDTTLAFSLRVMSNDGLVSTNQAIVYVMVKHYAGANSGISSGIPQQQQPLQPQQQPQQPVSPPSLQQPQSPPTTPTYPYQYPSPYIYRPSP